MQITSESRVYLKDRVSEYTFMHENEWAQHEWAYEEGEWEEAGERTQEYGSEAQR